MKYKHETKRFGDGGDWTHQGIIEARNSLEAKEKAAKLWKNHGYFVPKDNEIKEFSFGTKEGDKRWIARLTLMT